MVSKHRFITVGFLSTLVAAGAAGWGGCASAGQHGGGLGAGGNDGGFMEGGSVPPIEGLVSIALSPMTSSLTLQYPAVSPGATAQLQAEGTFQDGHTSDVTNAVSWSLSPSDIASVGGGTFSSLAPGNFTVTALAGTVASNPVTVTVKMVGNVVGTGVAQADLDGTPGGGSPTIAYPLDGALFPAQLGPIEFQVVPTSATQTEARIAFEGDNIDLKVYAPCNAIANATFANACTITVPPDLETVLDGASEGTMLTETVRLAAPGGGSLSESAPISARWSVSQLKGALLCRARCPARRTRSSCGTTSTRRGCRRSKFFTQSAPSGMQSDDQMYLKTGSCFGCHTISLGRDEDRPRLRREASPRTSPSSTWRPRCPSPASTSPARRSPRSRPSSPDGTKMVQVDQSVLMLRSADVNLATLTPNLFQSDLGSEMATTPFWSPKGDLLAFTAWVPVQNSGFMYDGNDLNGDQTPNSEIWAASVTGDMTFGTPFKLVPQVSGKSEFYPAISDDSNFVVFDESSCSGPATPGTDGYGLSPCDSYDDPSATLRLVSTKSGASPVDLTNASGTDTWSNSWPRFAPSHGTFQGKTLYWVAFSSRRPYGATLAGSNNPNNGDTEPQLWFAAVVVDSSGTVTADPSFAPVWMPQQNPAGTQRGNHSPQWVTRAVATVL